MSRAGTPVAARTPRRVLRPSSSAGGSGCTAILAASTAHSRAVVGRADRGGTRSQHTSIRRLLSMRCATLRSMPAHVDDLRMPQLQRHVSPRCVMMRLTPCTTGVFKGTCTSTAATARQRWLEPGIKALLPPLTIDPGIRYRSLAHRSRRCGTARTMPRMGLRACRDASGRPHRKSEVTVIQRGLPARRTGTSRGPIRCRRARCPARATQRRCSGWPRSAAAREFPLQALVSSPFKPGDMRRDVELGDATQPSTTGELVIAPARRLHELHAAKRTALQFAHAGSICEPSPTSADGRMPAAWCVIVDRRRSLAVIVNTRCPVYVNCGLGPRRFFSERAGTCLRGPWRHASPPSTRLHDRGSGRASDRRPGRGRRCALSPNAADRLSLCGRAPSSSSGYPAAQVVRPPRPISSRRRVAEFSTCAPIRRGGGCFGPHGGRLRTPQIGARVTPRRTSSCDLSQAANGPCASLWLIVSAYSFDERRRIDSRARSRSRSTGDLTRASPATRWRRRCSRAVSACSAAPSSITARAGCSAPVPRSRMRSYRSCGMPDDARRTCARRRSRSTRDSSPRARTAGLHSVSTCWRSTTCSRRSCPRRSTTRHSCGRDRPGIAGMNPPYAAQPDWATLRPRRIPIATRSVSLIATCSSSVRVPQASRRRSRRRGPAPGSCSEMNSPNPAARCWTSGLRRSTVSRCSRGSPPSSPHFARNRT